MLDVACGTAVPLVQPNGRVVGLDVNEGMLSVARHKSSEVALRPFLTPNGTVQFSAPAHSMIAQKA